MSLLNKRDQKTLYWQKRQNKISTNIGKWQGGIDVHTYESCVRESRVVTHAIVLSLYILWTRRT